MTRSFGLSQIRFSLGLEVCLAGLTLIVADPVDPLFELTLIAAILELLLDLYAEGVLIKTIKLLFSLSTNSADIFRLVFCQNLCKFTHNIYLFCCNFVRNSGETRS